LSIDGDIDKRDSVSEEENKKLIRRRKRQLTNNKQEQVEISKEDRKGRGKRR
jgi:hypothetical protein